MVERVRKIHPALKHGGYSATALLPGEDPAAFKKLHQDLIAEFNPSGALEDDIVATMARLVWRKQHLSTFLSRSSRAIIATNSNRRSDLRLLCHTMTLKFGQSIWPTAKQRSKLPMNGLAMSSVTPMRWSNSAIQQRSRD